MEMLNLAVLLFGLHALGLTLTEPIITPFEHSLGILFEKLGHTYLISSQWNLVTYYNFTAYTTEVLGLQGCITKIQKLCVPLKKMYPKNTNCEMILRQLDSHMTEISNYNELFPQTLTRTRRSLFDSGGAVLYYAFGVLDQKSAAQYDDKIAKIKTDQSYLLELIRNKTLITSHHVMRQTNETLNHQFAMFQNHLDQIGTDSNWQKVIHIYISTSCPFQGHTENFVRYSDEYQTRSNYPPPPKII